MATKTMISRPFATAIALATTSFSWVPNDTAQTDLYKLVNEVEADDDATYLHYSANTDNVQFSVSLPPFGSIISGLKLHVRAKGDASKTAFNSNLGYYYGGEILSYGQGINPTPAGTGWQNYTCDYSSNADFLNFINSNESDDRCIKFNILGGETGQVSKASTTDVTQVYLEITYEEPETATPIYLRENGAWNAVSGIIYRKENGVWFEADDTVFTQGDQFALNVIN